MVVRSTLDLALEYAAQGLRVFPCHEKNEPHAGRSSPYFLKALNFTSWATDASSDPDRVRELFTQFPNAMIGIAMGYGRFALDIDIKTVDGWASLAALGIKIPVDAPRIRTASGGSHVIFLMPDFPIGNWVGQVGPGLDIKTDGGYVIAAGSIRDDGPYEWVVGSSYLEAVPAPPALIARLRELSEGKARRSEAPSGEQRSDPAAGKWARAALDAELDKLSRVAPGARNDALNAPGTIRSGLEDGMAKPRHPGERPGGNGYDAEGFTAADPEPAPPTGDGAPPVGEPAEPAEELTAFETIPASTWHGQDRPLRQFFDERRLVPFGAVSILSGTGGVGKTLLMLQACVACVAGLTWLGAKVRRGPALFYSAEEPLTELHIRLDEICVAEEIFLDRLPELHLIDLADQPNASLFETNRKGVLEPTDRFKRLELTIAATRPALVVIDNRGQVVLGNENDRGVASLAMRALQLLAERYGCAIVLLSHPSQAGESTGSGQSGSTAWFATGRSALFLTYEGDESSDLRKLVSKKANYSKGGVEVALQWDLGRFKCLTPPPGGEGNLGRKDKAKRVFMRLLVLYTARNLTVTANRYAPNNYAPKVFARDDQREGLNPSDFDKAMMLLDIGEIEQVDFGPESKRRSKLRVRNKNAT
jgi:RecA-family ATPase